MEKQTRRLRKAALKEVMRRVVEMALIETDPGLSFWHSITSGGSN